MADWRVIEHTGRTLVTLIERRLSELAFGGVSVGLVTAAAFPSLAATQQPYISVFLYRIAQNPELRNAYRTAPRAGQSARPPLPLELSYIVTAWGVRGDGDAASDAVAAGEEARMLGVALQAFYDRPLIGRADLSEPAGAPVWRPEDSLEILLESPPVDTLYRIWDAAELGYRLSAVYTARVVGLEGASSVVAPAVEETRVQERAPEAVT